MRLRHALPMMAAILAPAMSSAQVSVDGQLGAEWAGVSATQVLFNPFAPTSNFGAPTNQNHATAYEILMRRDANWLYTAIRTTSGGSADPLMFANLYYSVRAGVGPFGSTGSSIGFEITNDRAFFPGGACCFNDNAGNLIQVATSTGAVDVLESAINLSAFWTNALGVTGFNPDPNPVGIRLNLSQSFGYSVAGGQAFYGDERLGFVPAVVPTPEPATLTLMASGFVGIAAFARRRRRNT